MVAWFEVRSGSLCEAGGGKRFAGAGHCNRRNSAATSAFAQRPPDQTIPFGHVIDPGNPLDRRPNTLAVRYGDPEWRNFTDFYGKFLTINGEVERLFKYHMEKLGAA